MKLKLSKESHKRFTKHITRLLLVLLVTCLTLLFTLVLNYKQLIYPPLNRNVSSPKQYVAGKVEVIEHGQRNKKIVALTFDADMTPPMYLMLKKGLVKSWYNKPIKDTLDRENVKATVFLGGLWIKAYPKEARDLAQDPLIEIGNHSYNHPAFTAGCFGLGAINDSADKNEVETAQTEIFAATGVIPKYFRFPGGCFDRIDVETVVKLGLKVVHWDVVAGDGFNNNVTSIINKVESKVQNGSIVVFHIHDGLYAPRTNDALVKIIPDLRKRGFEFVKVSEMLDDN